MQKPHILYVLTKLELGGAQKICLTLLEQLQNHACSSSLLSGPHGVLVDRAKKHKSVFLLKSFKREVGIKTIVHEFVAFFEMVRCMRKLKKQHPSIIVHTHSTKAGLVGRWAAFFSGIKNRVHTVHGFGFHEHQSRIGWWINVTLEYLTSFITTHYICVSRADRKIGATYFPQFAKKSSVIRAAVDWDTFYQPATKRKDTSLSSFTFGTVSCLKPQKNLLDMLKAFKHMYDALSPDDQKRVSLEIVGDGVQRPLLESWIAKHNMQENILLVGWQSDVAFWMRRWDVFVMSSLWEGLPCAIIEARLQKLPVVSYAIAGIPEVIVNNKNGFLVRAGNWKKLGERMSTLVKDDKLYRQMSSQKENLTDFSDTIMVKNHVALYRQLSN